MAETRANKIKKAKCWKVFQCKKKDCPAYKSEDLRCWLFSGTHCRDEIKGKFIDKIEMCLGCNIFKTNIDDTTMKDTCKVITKQFKDFKQLIQTRDRELRDISMELSIGITEVFEALKKIASGDPTVRIKETSKIELMKNLKHIVNLTAREIGEIVDQSHEIAIGIAEHFDVLHRVSKGDMHARVMSKSKIELMESLRKEINQTIESISQEITERKRAEKAIRAREERFRQITENAEEWIWEVDTDGLYIYSSSIVEKILGYRPEEIVGKKHFYDLFHPKERKELKKAALKAFALKQPFREFINRNISKSGQTVWLSTSGVPVLDAKGDLLGYRGADTDITKRKLSEEALQESEEKIRDILENANDMIQSIDAEGNFLYVNKKWCKTLGYCEEESKGLTFKDILRKDQKSHCLDFFERVKKGKTVGQIETVIVSKFGEEIFVEGNINALFIDGNFVSTRGIFRDITKRKQAQEKLKERETLLQLQFNRMPIGCITWDLDFRVLTWNPAAEKIFGFTVEDAKGKHPYDLIVPKDAQTHVETIWQRLLEGDITAHSENENITKDRRVITCYWVNTPLKKAYGEVIGVISMVQDISERKKAEKEVKKSKKELKDRVDELEEFYNLAIGRELRMIELKKEIEELRK